MDGLNEMELEELQELRQSITDEERKKEIQTAIDNIFFKNPERMNKKERRREKRKARRQIKDEFDDDYMDEYIEDDLF